MARDRKIFDQAMRMGTNYAWDKKWDQAVAEFRHAIAEFPEDLHACEAMGLALLNAGRLKQAVEVYQYLTRLSPDDPVPVERIAKIQEKLGEKAKAVESWMATADLHLRQRNIHPAVDIWQHVVELAPENILAHERLSKAYTGLQKTHQAVNQLLTLANLYQQKGENNQAKQACEQAIKLDPHNNKVAMALDALRHGESVGPSRAAAGDIDIFDMTEEDVEQDEGANLAETIRQRALSELANVLFDDSEAVGLDQLEIATLLAQGIDHQTRGNIETAIANYEKAVQAGVQSAAAFFNLGMLYHETARSDKAFALLNRAIAEPDYAPGAHFIMANSLRAAGQPGKALSHYMETLKILDLSLVERAQAQQLAQTYARLIASYSQETNQEQITTYADTLADYLTGADWEEKIREMRSSLDKLGDGSVISLAETLSIPNANLIIRSMARSEEYKQNGLLHSATEECLWAIQRAPAYLPLHERLAQIFLEMGEIEVATNKYLVIAQTHAIREEIDQALTLYKKALDLAPMNLEMRARLIRLLKDHNQVEKALEQHLQLAEAHYELTQVEEAQDQYERALDLAGRSTDTKAWISRILHKLGDLSLQKLDWREAIRVYQRLKKAVPDDIKARAKLTELYFNLQRDPQALAELDELIKLNKAQGKANKTLELLASLIESRPNEMLLRQRAAQLCIECDMRNEAIAHLDALGEMQLQANMIKEAVATIKAIIVLGPEDVQAYQQLLAQIT